MGLNPFRMEAVLGVHGHGHDHVFKKGLPVLSAVGRDIVTQVPRNLDSNIVNVSLLAGQQCQENKNNEHMPVPWHMAALFAPALPSSAVVQAMVMHGLTTGTLASAMLWFLVRLQPKTKKTMPVPYMQACLL